MSKLFAHLLLAAAVWTTTTLAQEPDAEDSADGKEVDMVIRGTGAGAPTLYGEPVKRVFAPNVHSWFVLDKRRLLLYATRSRPYLVTLRYKVSGLSHATVIGIKRNSTSIDARFDDIIVEGFPYPIERIEKLTVDMAKQLRGIDPAPPEDEVEDGEEEDDTD